MITRTSLIFLLTLLAVIDNSDGFTSTRPIHLRTSHATANGRTTAGSSSTTFIRKTAASAGAAHLKMAFALEPSSLIIASPVLSAAFAPALIPSTVPLIEAELFSDAAHIAFDLTSVLKPATLAVRIAAFVGRLLVIAGDYVPDHSMLPEEVIFQAVTLFVSGAALYESLSPLMKSALGPKDMNLRDQKCYLSLFRAAGVEWTQFQMISAVATEWVQVAPGSIITTDEVVHGEEQEDHHYLYWLYSGDVSVEIQGEVVETIQPKTARLLGDITFLSTNRKTTSSLQYPRSTTRAGTTGATLLRMDSKKLKKMMESDNDMDKVLRNVVLECMQERVASLLLSHAAQYVQG